MERSAIRGRPSHWRGSGGGDEGGMLPGSAALHPQRAGARSSSTDRQDLPRPQCRAGPGGARALWRPLRDAQSRATGGCRRRRASSPDGAKRNPGPAEPLARIGRERRGGMLPGSAALHPQRAGARSSSTDRQDLPRPQRRARSGGARALWRPLRDAQSRATGGCRRRRAGTGAGAHLTGCHAHGWTNAGTAMDSRFVDPAGE